MSAPPVDRLETGPAPLRLGGVPRRLLRGLGAALLAAVVLLGVSVATARGWQPPVDVTAPSVEALPEVAPWNRHLPYAFVDRADTVTDAGLRARVVRPRGAEGTIPGIVLVAGAGATTRDDLADEAEALARGGLAVLTYDKRTAGYGPLGRDDMGLADDALAAARTLARQRAVRPEVGLLGFSEGGWVVPLAAAREPLGVAYTVLVSAPVVSPLDQASWALDRELVRAPRAVRAGAASVLVLGRPMVGYLGLDVTPALRAAPQRKYAVWGADDASVPVAVAVQRFRAATGERGRVEVVPGAGHRVPVSTGWAERVSDWVRRGYPDDDRVRGVAPSDLAGLPTLPRPGWPADPRVALAVAVLVGVAAGAWPGRRRSVRSARSG